MMNKDYSNMNFTDRDRTQLKLNRDQIIQWIMENIVPMLKEDDRIYVDFGGTYSCPRTYSTIDNYHLAVYGSERNITSVGGRKTKGYIGYGEKFERIYQSFESTESPYEIYPVIDNWTTIKMCLMTRLQEMEKEKEAIYNFVI